jgi:hypothetical protein
MSALLHVDSNLQLIAADDTARRMHQVGVTRSGRLRIERALDTQRSIVLAAGEPGAIAAGRELQA